MFCKDCGAQIVPPGKFCTGCGRTLKGHWRKWLIWVGLGYAALLFVGLVASSGGSKKAEEPKKVLQPANDSPVPRADNLQAPRPDISKVPWLDGAKVYVKEAAGCVPDMSDWNLLAMAINGKDMAALRSLVDQGKVLLLDPGTRAVVVTSGLQFSRTNISIESGEFIGRNCDLLTQQLGARE